MNDDYRKLYDSLSSQKNPNGTLRFDIGDYESWFSKMQSPEQRKGFYEAMAAQNVSLGDYNEYEDRLKKKESFLGSEPAPLDENFGLGFGFDVEEKANDYLDKFKVDQDSISNSMGQDSTLISQLEAYQAENPVGGLVKRTIPMTRGDGGSSALPVDYSSVTTQEDVSKGLADIKLKFKQEGERELLSSYKEDFMAGLSEEQRGDSKYLRKLDDEMFLKHGLDLDLEGNGRYNEQWLAEDALRGLVTGAVDLTAGPLAIWYALTSPYNPKTKKVDFFSGSFGDRRRAWYSDISKVSGDIKEGQTQYSDESQGISTSLEGGDYYNAFRQTAVGISSTVPQIAGTVVAGALTGGVAPAVIGFGTVGALNYYQNTEMEDIEAVERGDIPLYDNNIQRLGGASVAGAGEAAFTYFGLKGGAISDKIIAPHLLRGYLKKLGVQPTIEALEEMGTELGTISYEMGVGNSQMNSSEVWHRIFDAGILGYGAGGVFGFVMPNDHSGRANTAANSRGERDFDQDPVIAALNEQSNTNFLISTVNAMKDEKKQKTGKRVKFFEMLSLRYPDTFNAIQMLDAKMEHAGQHIERLMGLPESSQNLKARGVLEARLEGLIQERETLLQQHNAESTALSVDEQSRLDNSKRDSKINSLEEEIQLAEESVSSLEDGPARDIAVKQREDLEIKLDALKAEDIKAPQGDITEDLFNRPAKLSRFGGKDFKEPLDGEVRVDGQRVVFETKDGKIYDLGNVDETSDMNAADLGLTKNESRVSVDRNGDLEIDGKKWIAQEDLPTSGIELDADGNPKSVSLVDEEGNTIMYTAQEHGAQMVEDIAYQVALAKAESLSQIDKVNKALEKDEELRQAHEDRLNKESDNVRTRETEETSPESAAKDPDKGPVEPEVKPVDPDKGPVEPTEEPDAFIPKKWSRKNLGFNTDNFKNLPNFLETFRKRWFQARKFMPKNMFNAKESMEGNIAALVNKVELGLKSFDKLLAKHKGDKKVLVDDYNKALEGDKEAKDRLPPELALHLEDTRLQIDNLTRELIKEGVIDTKGGSTKEILEGNLGSYLNRSYEVFNSKNWKDKVSEEVKTKARNFIRDMLNKDKSVIEDHANPAQNPRGLSLEAYIEERVEGLINKYTDPKGAAAFVEGLRQVAETNVRDESKTKGGPKIASKNTKALLKRQDVPAEIRALMGEYSDPMQRYASSIIQMAGAVEGAKFFQTVKVDGEGKYLFKSPTGAFSVPTKVFGETMYTTKEIAEEFDEQSDNFKGLMKAYLQTASIIKWAKTIGSVGTHLKNFSGNMGFVWSNGHSVLQMRTAYRVLRNDAKAGDDKALRASMDKYIRLGIVRQSASIGELKAMFKDASFDATISDRLSDLSRIRSKFSLKKVKSGLENLYQAEDDFFKIVAYESEIARYSEALHGKDYNSLSVEEKASLDAYVAEIVKSVYPTYSRVPEAIKMLRKFLVGNFVSFQAESYRVGFNTLSLAKKEIMSPNPKIRRIGAKRMAGTVSYLGFKSSTQAYFGAAAGVGIGGLVGRFLDDEEEDKKGKAVLDWVAPWAVNSRLIITDLGDGNFTYTDLSASDPFGQFDRIFNSMQNAESLPKAFATGLYETARPFLGTEMGTKALTNALYNQNDFGGNIYNPEADLSVIVEDLTAHFYKTFEFGTITSARKIHKSDYDGGEIAGQLTGLKPYTVNVKEQFGYKMSDFKKRLKNANKIKYEDYDQANEKVRDIYEEIHELTKSANTLGVSHKDLIEQMMGWGQLGKETSRYIILGRYKNITPPKN